MLGEGFVASSPVEEYILGLMRSEGFQVLLQVLLASAAVVTVAAGAATAAGAAVVTVAASATAVASVAYYTLTVL